MNGSLRQGSGEGSETRTGSASSLGAGLERQVALQRVMVYLRALNLPPVLSLELALEALRKAGDVWSSDHEGNLASSTMQTLWRILASRGIRSNVPWGGEGYVGGIGVSAGPPVVPPLFRRSMLPEELDRRPWITFLLRGVKQLRALGLKSPLVRNIFYLILLVAALSYLLVKIV